MLHCNAFVTNPTIHFVSLRGTDYCLFKHQTHSKLALLVCSVTAQEVVDAIEAQIGRKLDKSQLNLPDIKKIGTHDVSIRLHPNVTGNFKIVVTKLKEK